MTSELVARFSKQFNRGASIDIDLTQPIDTFSVTALIGPSGCGKTTLLRCLAGLTQPDQGRIEFGGRTWFDSSSRCALSPQRRDIGFLFQDYALFPHLNVAENMGYGVQRLPELDRRSRVAAILERFDLAGLENRFPRQLSGGQQQRVALGRVLVRRPKLLLLDEPLSALDAILRDQLRGELRRILVEFAVPTIVVTHDRIEAMSLADRVAVMDAGSIQQIGSMHEVFSRPKNARLARLTGVETVVPGEIVEHRDGLAVILVGSVRIFAVSSNVTCRSVYVCIKGEDVTLQKGACEASSVRNHVMATVTTMIPEGPLIRVGLDCGFGLTALITRPASEELSLSPGQTVMASFKATAIHLIQRNE